MFAVALLGASAILPRIIRDKGNKNSVVYHEIILGDVPAESWRKSIRNRNHHKKPYDTYKGKWEPQGVIDILDQERLSAYYLARKLHYMISRVRWSLVLLIAAVMLLAVTLSLPSFLSTQAEKCAMDPTQFNVTHLWQCSKFSNGSLAEQCANDPARFHMNKTGCLEFIQPINPAD